MKSKKRKLLIKVSNVYLLILYIVIEILLVNDPVNNSHDTIRNYVLKMKVRNKLGLRLSRWVGYTEIPEEMFMLNKTYKKALEDQKIMEQINNNNNGSGKKKKNKDNNKIVRD